MSLRNCIAECIRANGQTAKRLKRWLVLSVLFGFAAYLFSVAWMLLVTHRHSSFGKAGPKPTDLNRCGEVWNAETKELVSYGRLREEYLVPEPRTTLRVPIIYNRKVNWWLFKYDYTVTTNEKILDDPACLGYLIADASRVRFSFGDRPPLQESHDGPVYINIYDTERNKLLYSIVKHPTK